METRQKTYGLYRALATLAVGVLLAGCGTTITAPTIRTKSETELAVAAIRLEWLQECEGMATEQPENQVGSLLQDYVDLSGLSAKCKARHNDLVGYLRPIVKKEQGGE